MTDELPSKASNNPPLTWREARFRLRSFLSDYTRETSSSSVAKERQEFMSYTSNNRALFRILSLWIDWNLDIYIGAFGSSLTILIVATIAYFRFRSDNTSQEDDYNYEYYRLQFEAAILIFLGNLINLWLIHQRRCSSKQGNDGMKRRLISRFLREIEKQEEERLPRQDVVNDIEVQEHPLELDGTSLAGLYPVYRRQYRYGTQSDFGSWCRVPTLLLVKGDHIALQIGDVAPAACKLIENHRIQVQVQAGDILTLATFQETSILTAGKWPRGRTSLPKESDKLLTLCNNMRIFEVLETPLEGFLKQPRVPSRKPQVVRQVEAIRNFVSMVGALLFIATLVVLLARNEVNSTDHLLALPVPFLAAVATFPMISPACLIFIEALGTARILASYHPVAALRQDSPGTSGNIDLLLLRYFLATVSNRLSLQRMNRWLYLVMTSTYKFLGAKERKLSVGPNLVGVPPASLHLLEKLGVATAFTLVDDALLCEPQAVPQQLLIPSEKGLKLLDICPTYEDDESSDEDDSLDITSSRRNDDFHDSDSESEGQLEHHHRVPSRRKRRRLLRNAHRESIQGHATEDENNGVDHEVQFEDPLWWQHLPSLKCIGLASLLVEEKNKAIEEAKSSSQHSSHFVTESINEKVSKNELDECKRALVRHICTERRSMQLRSLAQCIGFSTKPNRLGAKGDISPFVEKHRLHVISLSRVKDRLEIDFHERDSEESRWWGLLRPDSTSVIVQDTRSGCYQLLTVGDPRVVTRMCSEAWQGENSTILPLSPRDRTMILETSNGWRLGDLDVEAFSYAPIPHTFEARCSNSAGTSKFYLLENDPRSDALLPPTKDKTLSGEWSLLHNQIFLGVLGSLIIPRQETQGLLSTLQDAGVRFVFMSPRNMRLTKEIASQMGIEIAWNAAISLRPLDEGQEDKYRMISNYADWDVNAKLPHGIENVKQHLKEVDNVPLLVSLYTDVTKVTTRQMIEVFQEYNDTVIAVGLSHLPWNSNIFSTADIGVGVDVLSESLKRARLNLLGYNSLLPSEIVFVSAISAHACAFRLRGVESIAYMPTILAHGRASLEAATAASLFLLSGCLSFGFYVFFAVCSVTTVVHLPEISGAFLTLQVIFPLMGLPMTMSDPDNLCMSRVPPKNDLSITFGKKEGGTLFLLAILKALPPAIFPQVLYLIAFGELMIYYEPDIVRQRCQAGLQRGDWVSVVRCDGISDYTGIARTSASTVTLVAFLLCIVVASAGFVHRTMSLQDEPPWRRNAMWVAAVLVSLVIMAIYLGLKLANYGVSWFPWYFYVIVCVCPFFCLAWVEYLKRTEKALLDRAEKLRRLQFETRLGMWSPK